MKILVTRSSAGGFGGAELSARDHVYGFNKLGHKVVFMSSLPRLREQVNELGVKAHKIVWPNKHEESPLRIPYYLFMTPIFWLQCLYYALAYRPDIIHAHSREDWIAFTLLKPIHRKPVVWRDPADLQHFLKNKPRSPFGRFNYQLLLRAVKKVDHVCTLNPEEKKVIIDRSKGAIKESRITVIPSSILFDYYDTDAETPRKTDKTVLGTMSLLREHKGIQYAIEAVERLSKKHDIELWVIGDGPFLKALKKTARGADNVIFWGFQADISPYLANFDIYVHPADFEGWGRNIKEAMYFKKPIVGTNVGGVALQIDDGKTGLLFEPKDVDQLTAHLDKLLTDRKLADKLAAAAQKKATKDGDYLTLIENKLIPIFVDVQL